MAWGGGWGGARPADFFHAKKNRLLSRFICGLYLVYIIKKSVAIMMASAYPVIMLPVNINRIFIMLMCKLVPGGHYAECELWQIWYIHVNKT